jgi:hypothetical protein
MFTYITNFGDGDPVVSSTANWGAYDLNNQDDCYCAFSDVQAKFLGQGMLFVGDEDQSGTFSHTETAQVNAGILDVCHEMDAFLQKSVPLQYTHGSDNVYLRSICVDLSMERLLEMGAGGVPDSVDRAALRARVKLKDISTGTTEVPLLKYKRDQPTTSTLINRNITGTQARVVNVK